MDTVQGYDCASVADAILGKKNAYADLYSPSRKLTWVPPILPPLSFTYIKNTVSVSHPTIAALLQGLRLFLKCCMFAHSAHPRF